MQQYATEARPSGSSSVSGAAQHPCQWCNRVFSRKWTLDRHMLIHEGEKPYHCNACGKAFRQKHDLNLHTRKKHNTWEWKKIVKWLDFSIVPCDLTRKIPMSLLQMLMTANQNTTSQFQRIQLEPETDGHHRDLLPASEAVHPCEVCARVFKKRHDLIKHRYIHTGEKPYACHLCDYRSTQSSNLNSHIRKSHPTLTIWKWTWSTMEWNCIFYQTLTKFWKNALSERISIQYNVKSITTNDASTTFFFLITHPILACFSYSLLSNTSNLIVG